ncbi:hypothetical protein [Streptomyces sp. NPDC054834]
MAKLSRQRLLLIAAYVLAAVVGYAVIRLWPFGLDGGGHPSDPTGSTSAKPSPGPTSWAFQSDVTWVAHAGMLTVKRDRTFVLKERSYRDCAAVHHQAPCDDPNSETGRTGIVVHGVVSKASGTRATGRITRTTAPTSYPVGGISFTLDPAHDAISAHPSGVRENPLFCGPTAPPMWCGA